MSGCSLVKYLRYIPRLVWMCCAVGIIVISLQGRIAREEHLQLSGQKREVQTRKESSIFGERVFVEKIQQVKQNMLLIESILSLPVSDIAELPPISEVSLPDMPEASLEILPAYQDLYNQNNDLAGWLKIEGTVIDYPVMQCDNNEFYLYHNFYGEESRYGELFVKAGCPLDMTGSNIIIYGHHMNDGSMFSSLMNYVSSEFYEKYPFIQLDTLYEQFTYEIVAVFRSQVYEDCEDVFQYYQYYGELSEEYFKEFYQNIQELTIYDTGVKAVYGDSLLTLSTCAYHVKNGRFVVVAKKVL